MQSWIYIILLFKNKKFEIIYNYFYRFYILFYMHVLKKSLINEIKKELSHKNISYI